MPGAGFVALMGGGSSCITATFSSTCSEGAAAGWFGAGVPLVTGFSSVDVVMA